MQYGSPVQDFLVFAIKTKQSHLTNQYNVLQEVTTCLDKLPPIQTGGTSCLTGGWLPPVLPPVLPPIRQEATSGLDSLPLFFTFRSMVERVVGCCIHAAQCCDIMV